MSTGDPGGALGPAGKDTPNLSPSMISSLNDQSQREYERWQQKAVNVLKENPELVRSGKKAIQDLNGAKPSGWSMHSIPWSRIALNVA